MNSMKVSVRVGGISVKKELVASKPTRGNANDKATPVATTKVKQENASVGIKAEYDDATDDDEFDPKVFKPPIKTGKGENASIKAEYDEATDNEEEQTLEVRDVATSEDRKEYQVT